MQIKRSRIIKSNMILLTFERDYNDKIKRYTETEKSFW